MAAFYECPVCVVELTPTGLSQPVLVGTCGHTACIQCFDQLRILPTSKCPICRGDLFHDKPIYNQFIINQLEENNEDPEIPKEDFSWLQVTEVNPAMLIYSVFAIPMILSLTFALILHLYLFYVVGIGIEDFAFFVPFVLLALIISHFLAPGVLRNMPYVVTRRNPHYILRVILDMIKQA